MSLPLGESLNEMACKLMKNNGMSSIFSKPLNFSIVLTVMVLIISYLCLEIETDVYAKLFKTGFYTFIVILFFQLIHFTVVKTHITKSTTTGENFAALETVLNRQHGGGNSNIAPRFGGGSHGRGNRDDAAAESDAGSDIGGASSGDSPYFN